MGRGGGGGQAIDWAPIITRKTPCWELEQITVFESLLHIQLGMHLRSNSSCPRLAKRPSHTSSQLALSMASRVLGVNPTYR